MTGTAWLQSYSGVRATLGLTPDVSPDAEAFAFRHAYCYALSRLQADPSPRSRFVLARDPRPTSPALARAQAEGLASACRHLGVSLDLVDLGVASTPLWQHSVRLFDAQGGVMITASHNPIEDNGWKRNQVTTVTVDPPHRARCPRPDGELHPGGGRVPVPCAETVTLTADTGRAAALVSVRFIAETYSAHTSDARVVLDPNGGAACAIADRVFRALGIEPIVVNGREGEPAHEIDVEHVHADGTHVLNALADRVRRERALFGLAFDFDADRGNLTYVDAADRVHIPSPQAAAAINTAIALAVHHRSGDARAPAVVASDATSCRVKQIAAAFGADVVEVETGEIHVVSAMHDLDARGRRAVVGVEGANGGTIFAGTTCRDGALVGAGALLAAADDELRAIIAATLAPGHTLAPGLSGLIDVLPPQRSLSLKYRASADWSKTVDHLERELARVFAAGLSSDWARFDFRYTYTKYAGPERPVASGYGWKVRFFRPGAEAFLWIRGSKTEAGIVRIVGDAPDAVSAQALLDLGQRLLDDVV